MVESLRRLLLMLLLLLLKLLLTLVLLLNEFDAVVPTATVDVPSSVDDARTGRCRMIITGRVRAAAAVYGDAAWCSGSGGSSGGQLRAAR
jgi:hypothetical protein